MGPLLYGRAHRRFYIYFRFYLLFSGGVLWVVGILVAGVLGSLLS